MINLLPSQQKEELLGEKNFKLVLILGIVILAFLICFSLILFSIKISIAGQLSAQKFILSQKEAETLQTQDLENKIKSLNLTISKLDSFYQSKLDWVEVSEKISQNIPSKIYLTSLTFKQPTGLKKEEYLGDVSLTGFSPSRETLIEFKKNLEKEEQFSEVYFPPENWVQATDINFTVNFKVQ